MTMMIALLPQPRQQRRRRKQPSKRPPWLSLLLCACIVGLSPLKECNSFSMASPRHTTRGLPDLTKQISTLDAAPQFSSLYLRPLPKLHHRLNAFLQPSQRRDSYVLEPSEQPLRAFTSPLFREPQRRFVSLMVPDGSNVVSLYRGGKALKHQSSSSSSSSASRMTPSQTRQMVLQYMIQFIACALYQAHELAERQAWLSPTWSFQKTNHQVGEINENLNFVWQAAGNALVQHGLMMSDLPRSTSMAGEIVW
jgi:hypothetical protein